MTATPISGSINYSYFDGTPSLFTVGFGGNGLNVFMTNPSSTSAGGPVNVQCNCLTPSAQGAVHSAVNAPGAVFLGSSSVPNFDYSITYQFNFEPWTGGTVTNNNAITGAFGNQVIWDYRLTDGIALVSGSFQVRSRATGECLWCDSFTGTATVSANIGGPQLVPGYQEGRGDFQFRFSGQTTDATGVPEPSAAGMLGLGGAVGLGLLRLRRSQR